MPNVLSASLPMNYLTGPAAPRRQLAKHTICVLNDWLQRCKGSRMSGACRALPAHVPCRLQRRHLSATQPFSMPAQGRAAADGIRGGRGDRDGLPSAPRQVRTHASIQRVQPSPRVLGWSCMFARSQDSASSLLSQKPLLCSSAVQVPGSPHQDGQLSKGPAGRRPSQGAGRPGWGQPGHHDQAGVPILKAQSGRRTAGFLVHACTLVMLTCCARTADHPC